MFLTSAVEWTPVERLCSHSGVLAPAPLTASVRHKTEPMKRILKCLFAATMLVTANGCASYAIVQKAKGNPNTSLLVNDPTAPLGEPHPSYYGFLLATVPFDAVTLPLQGIGIGLTALVFAGAKDMH